MDISKIKISIGILGIVLLQAAGIIWFVAQLDASVNTLQKDTSRIETSFYNLSESTKDLSRISLFDQQLLLINDKVLANTSVIEDKIHADAAVLDTFTTRLQELDDSIAAYITMSQKKLKSLNALNSILEGVSEDNPLITQESLTEALKSKAQKGKTNRLLTEADDRITILENWMNEVLEAERIAEEKKQEKKDKKDKKK